MDAQRVAASKQTTAAALAGGEKGVAVSTEQVLEISEFEDEVVVTLSAPVYDEACKLAVHVNGRPGSGEAVEHVEVSATKPRCFQVEETDEHYFRLTPATQRLHANANGQETHGAVIVRIPHGALAAAKDFGLGENLD